MKREGDSGKRKGCFGRSDGSTTFRHIGGCLMLIDWGRRVVVVVRVRVRIIVVVVVVRVRVVVVVVPAIANQRCAAHVQCRTR